MYEVSAGVNNLVFEANRRICEGVQSALLQSLEE
jgi:hypothetical protein